MIATEGGMCMKVNIMILLTLGFRVYSINLKLSSNNHYGKQQTNEEENRRSRRRMV